MKNLILLLFLNGCAWQSNFIHRHNVQNITCSGSQCCYLLNKQKICAEAEFRTKVLIVFEKKF